MAPGGTDIKDRITPRLLIQPGVMAEPSEDAKALSMEVTGDKSGHALKRSGLPEEQASAIAFLASEDSSYITGQIIRCAGTV